MFNSMFDPDGLFNSIWNKFNRPVLDQRPINVYKDPGKGYILAVNALGISKDNLSVKIEKQKGNPYKILRITGQTEISKINFTNSIDLAIQLNFNEPIESVSYTTKDGLCIVFLKMELPTEDDDDKGLDW